MIQTRRRLKCIGFFSVSAPSLKHQYEEYANDSLELLRVAAELMERMVYNWPVSSSLRRNGCGKKMLIHSVFL